MCRCPRGLELAAAAESVNKAKCGPLRAVKLAILYRDWDVPPYTILMFLNRDYSTPPIKGC